MEQFFQDNPCKIAIVGAGPAGIYCALNILFEFKNIGFTNFNISIFDKSQALRTILPTGGGRCNITNSNTDIKEFASNYPRGEKFLYSLFSRHFNSDALEFFKLIGIKTYTQVDNRVFPISDSAKDVKDKMLSALKSFKNVKLINKEIKSGKDLEGFDRCIISCGSKGVEELIESFNQPLIPFRRALCGFIVKDFKYPKGVSVKSLEGDFIFTDNGISGPLPFKVSSIDVDKKYPYNLKIKLFDENKLFELIEKNSKKSIGNLVSELIPKSLAKVIVEDFDKKSAEVSKKKILEYSILNLEILSTSKQGEIVNAGGVDLSFVDKNCKSKINDNLWFCGEVLDIDGFCGGFNLQNCWSSGYVVAKDVVCSIIKK